MVISSCTLRNFQWEITAGKGICFLLDKGLFPQVSDFIELLQGENKYACSYMSHSQVSIPSFHLFSTVGSKSLRETARVQ